MRVLLSLLLMCGGAQGQVIDCPRTYPLEPTALAGNDRVIVEPARLSGGSVYIGALGGNGQMQGDAKEVKGGVNTLFSPPAREPKWFVCSYGTIGFWWPLAQKTATCTAQTRGRSGAITVTAECK